MLGVSVRTLQNWRYEGRGGPTYVKVGANVRYTGQALIDFIAAHTVDMGEVA
ncbi:helix-turn-helix domain-containing protein [Microbacterium phosphatis]|uniref:helix-turn-helix domain-containing protein n=1 Tax=Microbacterium phosphatis TaxID=3140248 RepID=UPI003BA30553